MLAIRLQRTGRKGHANYRIVVQDSRRTPTSGNIVMQIGHYDPHTKAVKIDKDKAELYMKNGAQPSDRVIGLFKKEGIKMPKWVKVPLTQKKTTKSPEKLRKNRPAEPKVKEEPKAEELAETPTEETKETPVDDVAAAEATEQVVETEAPAKEETTAVEPEVEETVEEPTSPTETEPPKEDAPQPAPAEVKEKKPAK